MVSKNTAFRAHNEQGLNIKLVHCDVASPQQAHMAYPLACFATYQVHNTQSMLTFRQLLKSMSEPRLQTFIADVLYQGRTCHAYLSAPASLNHHHNYRGGLFDHSVEVAQIMQNLPLLSNDERNLGICAGLMHDVGKTLTLSDNMRRTDLGQLADHDELTLEICADALANLALHKPQLANLLRHIWTCGSPGARYGYKPKTRVAWALQLADRMSATSK